MSEVGENLYQPIRTGEIKTTTETKDIEVRPPFEPQKPTAAVSTKNTESLNESRYVILPSTGRVVVDQLVSNKVVWGGNLPGDIYGARDQKGSRMDKQVPGSFITDDPSSPYGMRAE